MCTIGQRIDLEALKLSCMVYRGIGKVVRRGLTCTIGLALKISLVMVSLLASTMALQLVGSISTTVAALLLLSAVVLSEIWCGHISRLTLVLCCVAAMLILLGVMLDG